MIYRGRKAKKILWKNLDNREYNRCLGYFRDKKLWVAFDNTTGACFVEEFKSEQMAICWIANYFSVSEIEEEFEVFRLKKDLFFIPIKKELLKVYFYNDQIFIKSISLIENEIIFS